MLFEISPPYLALPYYECHYSRESTKHKYLGPELNKEKMYTLYLEFCKENHMDETHIAKHWVYFDVFDKHFQLPFKPPEVDTCDLCDSFQARLIDNTLGQTDKSILMAEYESHLFESQRRYNLKSEDTKMSKTTPTHKVLTGNLQKCLPTSLLTNCISFYKRKLWTLNYTLLIHLTKVFTA
ncbi:hypothetical protein PR048_013695 [Dryococelus australis]|uniref:Uncharacterized protein n=1 Tax=Dryococelus australis TaxID=614101 RepID=A0ABQ9HT72_9NEOP|nr:hypothetical protein PR048_013695 [Dryococelus australis]